MRWLGRRVMALCEESDGGPMRWMGRRVIGPYQHIVNSSVTYLASLPGAAKSGHCIRLNWIGRLLVQFIFYLVFHHFNGVPPSYAIIASCYQITALASSYTGVIPTLVTPTLVSSLHLSPPHWCHPHTGVTPTLVSSLHWCHPYTCHPHTSVILHLSPHTGVIPTLVTPTLVSPPHWFHPYTGVIPTLVTPTLV